MQIKNYNAWAGIFLISLAVLCNCGRPQTLEGPELVKQPSPVTYFSNSVGLNLECFGRGHPPISTRWLTAEGNFLPEIPGIREIRNNSLHLLPFRGEDFLASVHDTRYRCSVSNPIGTMLSTIFAVHTIIDEPFEVSIRSAVDENDLLERNAGFLYCDVKPAIYKEFVKIISWKTINEFGRETEIESDGNVYQISALGSLVVFSVKPRQLFLCLSQNTLNKKIQSSSPFMLKSAAVGAGGLMPANIASQEWRRIVYTEIGNNIDLLCLSTGNPSPNFRWEKWRNGKYIPLVSADPRGRMWGPLLSFDGVTSNSNGSYRIEVMNSLGSFSLEVDLVVVSPLPRVELLPKKRTVGTGQNVDMLCELYFQSPDDFNQAEITWWKDGKRLFGDGGGSRIRISSQRLSILNTVYQDQGVYQIFVQTRKQGQVGASTLLLLPPSEPELIYTFISQLLQPGPIVSLKCSATANPIPHRVQWYLDHSLISPSQEEEEQLEQIQWRESNLRLASSSYVQMNEIVSHLNISSVQVQDSGLWTCRIENILSSVSHSARINVYGKLFVKEMGRMTFVADTTALIPCLYGGYPVDQIVWRHNGSEIDTKGNRSRFRILSNRTLQIEHTKPGEDRGEFTCTVSNRKGETASGSATVNVLRPPVISSFSFDDNLQEGQRTSISCNVMSGDLPIQINWFKDSMLIPQGLNVTPLRVKFLSNLIFEELKGIHSGEYTCSASNAALSVNFSATLSVKVPPSWWHEPMNSRTLLKSDVIMPCQAKGWPKPSIRWYKETPPFSSRTVIRPDHKFQILENGSLMILNVESKDVSYTNFTCEAANEVLTIQKSINVSVIIPAQASAAISSIVIAEGLPAHLKCQIRGDRPVQVIWRKKSIVIENSPRVVLQTVLDGGSLGIFSAELKIVSSEKFDAGTYHCQVFNQYGRDEDQISLHVKARPLAPDLIIEEIQSRFIRLTWTLISGNLSEPVTHFILQYKNSSVILWDSQCTNITVQAPATATVLRNLSPVTNYQIRILALNEIGRSLPTQHISVTTLAEAPSGPPLNITAISTSPRTIIVRWEPPSHLLRNGEILGFYVLVSPATISILSNSTLVIDEKWGHQTEISDLKPNSRYHICVRAYNIAGMGPESSFISISTPEGAPSSPPQNVVCDALSPKSLQVVWESPPAHLANGIIQGYKVIYSPASAELQGEKPEVKKTINKETTLHGLTSYTNYSVRTLAFTNGGESVPSESVFCTTEEDLPDQPADIKVFPSGVNSVTVSWLPPRFPNGIITKYRVAWKSDDLEGVKDRYYVTSGNEDQMLMEVRRLKENKRYTFWVTPATSLGLGKPSEMLDVTVTSKVVAKIASFPVTRRPRLREYVSLPCRAVGLAEITWLKGSSSYPLKNVMRNGTFYISGVKPLDEDTYICRASNDLGTDEIHHQISISRPPSPVSILLGYVTSNSIQVYWDPLDTPLTGYTLQYRTGSMMEWKSKRLGASLTSYSIDRLLCGTAYQIKLAPENSIGFGEFSQTLRTKTNGNPPQFPKLTDIIDGNGTMIRVDLNRFPDGGCILKKFHLEFKTKASNEWNTIHRNNNSSRVFILNTTLGAKYDFKISLENEAGSISKTFSVESSPQFFTNYDKLLQNSEDAVLNNESWDPHIIVPIISATICTTAIIICIFIVVKRKTDAREGWKLGNSSSQQTWLSSDDFRLENKPSEKNKIEVDSGMSVYATLNSRKPIPMTIRDSTVRFQTFGQVENYEAPPMPTTYGRTRGNFNPSMSHEELIMQEAYEMNQKCRDTRELQDFRRLANSNEYSVDEIMHDYAHPYQVVPVNRGSDVYVRNTLRKQKRARSRGSVDPTD